MRRRKGAASVTDRAVTRGQKAQDREPPSSLQLSPKQTFAVADIKIGERHRKDMGDIDGLAASMDSLTLLQPIVVRPDGTLIAGERRLHAAKRLGWTEIRVN